MKGYHLTVAIIWCIALAMMVRCAGGHEGHFHAEPVTQLRPVDRLTPIGRLHLTQEMISQGDKPAPSDPAVVYIRTPDHFGGSAVVIEIEEADEMAVIVTNWHVVVEEQSRQSQNPLCWPVCTIDGKKGGKPARLPFKLVHADIDTDFAVLISKDVRSGPGYPLASRMPAVGEPVTITGWGGGQQTTRTAPRMDVGHNLSIDCEIVSGDSGGAMTHNGALVGVAFGWPSTARSKPSSRPHAGHPASSHVSLSTLHQVLAAAGKKYGFTPVVKENGGGLTQYQICPPGQPWGTAPGGRSIAPQPRPQPSTPSVPPHSHALPDHDHDLPDHTHDDIPAHTHDVVAEHEHEIRPHSHPLPDHDHPYQFDVGSLTEEQIEALRQRLGPIWMRTAERQPDGSVREIRRDPIYLNKGWTFFTTPGVTNQNVRVSTDEAGARLQLSGPPSPGIRRHRDAGPRAGSGDGNAISDAYRNPVYRSGGRSDQRSQPDGTTDFRGGYTASLPRG